MGVFCLTHIYTKISADIDAKRNTKIRCNCKTRKGL